MELGLKDKRALVLGSTRGLGRGIADALAAEGAVVAVCGRKADDAGAVADDIAARHGTRAERYAIDLMDSGSVAALCDSVAADFGGIDCLLLNSGGPPPGPLAATAAETWSVQFQAMFLSQLQISGAFLPGMRERGWGRILVTSSSGAVQPIPNLGISNTLRAGLLGWVKTLSNEVAGDGVTVNTIQPGRIHTERVDELDRSAAERLGKTVDEIVVQSRAAIPVGRYGAVEEYAAVAAFLMSDRASYITGAVIPVDGGFIRAV